jgi:hypothetical protein
MLRRDWFSKAEDCSIVFDLLSRAMRVRIAVLTWELRKVVHEELGDAVACVGGPSWGTHLHATNNSAFRTF